MKKVIVILSAILLLSIPALAGAWDWNSSPQNWNNSPHNWENSPQNWNNSPRNWHNSPMKYGNERIIRDQRGNPSGYAVPRSDGGVNFFDMQGNRRGYQPGR